MQQRSVVVALFALLALFGLYVLLGWGDAPPPSAPAVGAESSALDGAAQGFNVNVMLASCRAIDLDGSLAAARATMADSGVDLSQADASQKALFVRPNATYRLALFQFLLYSHKKCCESPNLSLVSRKLLSWILRAGIRLTRPKL